MIREVITRELRTFPYLEAALDHIKQVTYHDIFRINYFDIKLTMPFWLDCERVTPQELDIMQTYFKFHDITKKDLFEEDPSNQIISSFN